MIQEKVLFAVYGTLKKGHGNYNYLLEGNSKFLGTHITEPMYTMHNFGGFPAVRKDGTTAITTEIYEVVDPNTIQRVFSLEGYTGTKDSPDNWYDTTTINTPYGEAEMFYMKQELNNPVIESGIF